MFKRVVISAAILFVLLASNAASQTNNIIPVQARILKTLELRTPDDQAHRMQTIREIYARNSDGAVYQESQSLDVEHIWDGSAYCFQSRAEEVPARCVWMRS